jgi:hypothetical protein
MKRILLTILLTAAFSNLINAQNLTVGTAGMPLREIKGRMEQGSSYFNDQFVSSAVVTSDGKHLTLEAIRYNTLNQQVEYLSKDVVYEVQDSLTSFTVTDSTGKSHFLQKQQMNGKPYFFEVLASGKVGLLKHYTARKSETEDWYTKKKVQALVKKSEYYILKGGKLDQFYPSRKNIISVFNEKPDQVKLYLNNNSPNFKSDESLKELFEFYNSLTEKA